jgi:proteasome lid subunit RPN8/RPN11
VADLEPFRLYAEIGRCIVDQVGQAWPVEACGLVYGRDELQSYRAMNNTLLSESEFAMDPADLVAAMQDIENLGVGLQAVYHSHTRTGPEPSRADVAAAAYYPDVVQLILGVKVRDDVPFGRRFPRVDVKAYRYHRGWLVPVPLVLPGSTAIGARTNRNLSR